MKIITPEILKTWSPCSEGYKRFLELLPQGGTLEKCINVLVSDNHDDWAKWLFDKCKNHDNFKEQTLKGYRNSGDWNSGYRNSGYRNSGDCNSGDRNSGDWNSGDWNSGFFNSITPNEILIFNKACDIKIWRECYKPNFLFFNINKWINESEMTDKEKIDNPNFYVCGGYLKKIPYKEAFKKSWDEASKEDKRLVFDLPNFDATVFFEISGIDVNSENLD